MVNAEFDIEAENVLREIRENLKAELNLEATTTSEATIRQTLALLEGDLFVTARTWNSLPPVVSNRQGWKARLELWVKRLLKRATNWYTWEQVNFNAATNNALHSIEMMITNYEKEQAILRAQIEELNSTIEALKTNKN
jgi:hypothetical protein